MLLSFEAPLRRCAAVGYRRARAAQEGTGDGAKLQKCVVLYRKGGGVFSEYFSSKPQGEGRRGGPHGRPPKPPIGFSKGGIGFSKPPIEISRPPIEITKPPTEISKPPTDFSKGGSGKSKRRGRIFQKRKAFREYPERCSLNACRGLYLRCSNLIGKRPYRTTRFVPFTTYTPAEGGVGQRRPSRL